MSAAGTVPRGTRGCLPGNDGQDARPTEEDDCFTASRYALLFTTEDESAAMASGAIPRPAGRFGSSVPH
jgi:hypothetical protein